MVQQSQSETTPKLTQKRVSWSRVTVCRAHTQIVPMLCQAWCWSKRVPVQWVVLHTLSLHCERIYTGGQGQ